MKEFFAWQHKELFSAYVWPVKNSRCLQIYFQASDHNLWARKASYQRCAEDQVTMIGRRRLTFSHEGRIESCADLHRSEWQFLCEYGLLDIHRRCH
jgi:hypothetical protein